MRTKATNKAPQSNVCWVLVMMMEAKKSAMIAMMIVNLMTSLLSKISFVDGRQLRTGHQHQSVSAIQFKKFSILSTIFASWQDFHFTLLYKNESVYFRRG